MTLSHTEYLSNANSSPTSLLSCSNAAELIERGDYDGAHQALGDCWRGIGEEPDLRGLSNSESAEVLLQVAVLSGWLASAQVRGSQDQAKDLLTKSLRLFETVSNSVKVAEVKYELGMCYWRTGSIDEARVVLHQALNGLEDTELRAKVFIRLSIVELWEGRYLEAWDSLKEAQSFFENCSDVTKSTWHGQQGLVLRRLATAENRSDYADRAIMEFTAAIYHCELAGHERYRARHLNNLAMLLYKLGRYAEAHQNLDCARDVFSRLKDTGNIAQVDETRCQVLLAENRYQEGEAIIGRAVSLLESAGEQALLADALTTHATILARLEKNDSSMATFHRAIRTAEEAGANVSAGLAVLSLIEEHQSNLGEAEIFQAYDRADNFLRNTRDAEHIARLRKCARIAVGKIGLTPDLVLSHAVLIHEARYIERALLEENGSVTRAAKRLGVTHQGLAFILKTRHKELLNKRNPITPRRKSLFRPWKVLPQQE